MNGWRNWLDARTSYRELCTRLLYEPLPGGQRWKYVWGSTLVFTFLIQVITGFFLWTAYSPSTQTAWESVYFIQHHMQMGWFVRGLHHYTAQIMIILLACHLIQVVIAGAYRTPRELNWWFGLILMKLTLGLSLTGYLLPWDEKGYWATQTSTKIIGITPIIGPSLQTLLVGGVSYGHQTLTRFFALHAGLLPALFILTLVVHVALFRKQGVTHPKNTQRKAYFWPSQALLDLGASLAVLSIIVFLVIWGGFEQGIVLGVESGANLQAPAAPDEPYSAARPEWYFLFLFQFLKYFPGSLEVVGAIIIPSLVVGLLFLFPLIARLPKGHAFCRWTTLVLMGSILLLTGLSMWSDSIDPAYQKAVADAEIKAKRSIELANHKGIPKEGAIALLRSDPLSRGPYLFQTHCSVCHRWNGHDGTDSQIVDPSETALRDPKHLSKKPVSANLKASDLGGFGTQRWISEFLKDPSNNKFFGHTKLHNSDMANWSKQNIPLMSEEEINDVSWFLSSQAQLPNKTPISSEVIERGAEIFSFGSWDGAQPCSDCHRLDYPNIPATKNMVPAPDLTRYASEEWLLGMILDPTQTKYYGPTKNEMPKFLERLTSKEAHLIAKWLRRDWFSAHQKNLSDTSLQ